MLGHGCKRLQRVGYCAAPRWPRQPWKIPAQPPHLSTRRCNAPGVCGLSTLQSQESIYKPEGPRPRLASRAMPRETDFGILLSHVLSRHFRELSLIRVGGFYETYGPGAEELASLLSITIGRKKLRLPGQTEASFYPMAGFPAISLEPRLRQLVQSGHRRIALYEQQRLSDLDNTLTRRLTRIYTPGTLFEAAFTVPDQNSFLLAITPHASDGWAMAYTDISTGELFEGVVGHEQLAAELARIDPKEVLLPHGLEQHGSPLWPIIDRAPLFISTLESTIDVGGDPKGVLQEYLRQVMPTLPIELGSPLAAHHERMHLSATALSALEVKQTKTAGVLTPRGSLISYMKRTSTPGGGRILIQRLCAPSRSRLTISRQLDMVQLFVEEPLLRSDLQDLLRGCPDAGRIWPRLASNTFTLADVERTMQFCNILQSVVGVASAFGRVQCSVANSLICQFEGLVQELTSIRKRLASIFLPGSVGQKYLSEAEIDPDDSLLASFESVLCRLNPRCTPAFYKAYQSIQDLEKSKADLATSLARLIGTRRVELIFDGKSLSSVIKIPASAKVPCDFELIRSTKGHRVYKCDAWTKLHSQIQVAAETLRDAQSAVLRDITNDILPHLHSLRVATQAIEDMDVDLSFADVAFEMGWVRPIIDDKAELCIEDGRHPTVEMAAQADGRTFQPNSLLLERPKSLAVITGPNMGGKSTYLRQTALIVLLAQSGSFVPAKRAHIGLVDTIFTRIGAHDDTVRHRSTFMEEMSDIADIVENSSMRSLVLIDELGRGTSPEDGLAIAIAVAEQLVHITQLLEEYPKQVLPLRTVLKDDNPCYKVSHGISRRSDGIATARNAGLPETVLARAKKNKKSQ